MGSKRIGHNWATEMNWTELIYPEFFPQFIFIRNSIAHEHPCMYFLMHTFEDLSQAQTWRWNCWFYGASIINFISHHQGSFQSTCTSLHSRQKCAKSSCFCLYMLRVPGIFIFASLLGAKCYLIMVLIWISLITFEMEHHFMHIGPSNFLFCDLPFHLFGLFFIFFFLLSCFTFLLNWSYLCILDININIRFYPLT